MIPGRAPSAPAPFYCFCRPNQGSAEPKAFQQPPNPGSKGCVAASSWQTTARGRSAPLHGTQRGWVVQRLGAVRCGSACPQRAFIALRARGAQHSKNLTFLHTFPVQNCNDLARGNFGSPHGSPGGFWSCQPQGCCGSSQSRGVPRH